MLKIQATNFYQIVASFKIVMGRKGHRSRSKRLGTDIVQDCSGQVRACIVQNRSRQVRTSFKTVAAIGKGIVQDRSGQIRASSKIVAARKGHRSRSQRLGKGIVQDRSGQIRTSLKIVAARKGHRSRSQRLGKGYGAITRTQRGHIYLSV